MEWIKQHEFYTGKREKFQVSVSELSGDDVLAIYLRREHDIVKEDKITQATLGSIFDLGIRQVANEQGLESLGRVLRTFDKWVISGEGDLIDRENNTIIDVKLTKIYALEQWKKDPLKHQYTKQLNWYRVLMGDESTKLQLYWFLKDQTETKDTHPKEALVVTDVPVMDEVKLFGEMIEKLYQLEALYNGGKREKCDDTWGNDTKCRLFCDCKSVCPYASKRGYNKATFGW